MQKIENYETLNEEQLRTLVEQNLFKVRECSDYWLEYKQCKSLSARFHQYFVDGTFHDCSHWKEDMKNCEKPFTDLKAMASIIVHEDERLKKRKAAHLANDVWERREEPPPEWNTELPDFLKERVDDSYQLYKEKKFSCTIF